MARTRLEVWKEVPGWSGYEVSDGGRVYKKPFVDKLGHKREGRVLKQKVGRNKSGNYKSIVVTLSSNGVIGYFSVARLMLLAFKGCPLPEQTQARHLDSNSFNNKLSNLAWGTYEDNLNDKIAVGRSGKGSTNSQSKLSENDVLDIKELCKSIVIGGRGGKSFKRTITIDEIAKKFNVSRTAIKLIKSGVSWTHV